MFFVFLRMLFGLQSRSDIWGLCEFTLIWVLWRSSYAISGREGILKLISVDSAMWEQKELLFILVYGFLFTFLNYTVSYLSSVQQFSPLVVKQ
jgi:hypothetical protein